MFEGIAFAIAVLILVVASLAEPLLRAKYAWKDFKAWTDYDRRLDSALRKAGLDAYAEHRAKDRLPRRKTQDPPVWNRDPDSVDRTDGIDRLRAGHRDSW